MLAHEFFHEQAHINKRHEQKRFALLLALLAASFAIYRLFCHAQEFEADRLAASKCGKKAAIESLKLLQIKEGKRGIISNLLSLHPKTKNRIQVFK